MPHSATRGVALVPVAALVTLVATACGGAATRGGVTTVDPPATASSDATPAAAGPVRVDDAVSLRGEQDGESVDVTVITVLDHAQGADPDLDTPPEGDHYYAVQLRIKNTGTMAYDDSPGNGAKVIDIAGQSYDCSAAADTTAGQSLPADTTIAPGGSAQGYLTFEVADNATITRVQFGLDSGFSQTAQWVIQ